MGGVRDIHTAARHGKHCRGGVEVEIEQCLWTGSSVAKFDCHEWAPLHVAAFHGRLAAVEKLLERRADPNQQTGDGTASTALLLACQMGHGSVVKFLGGRGAELDHKDSRGQTALSIAAWGGHLPIVKILCRQRKRLSLSGFLPEHTTLRAGGFIARRLRDPSSALQAAAEQGHTAVVQFLLARHTSLSEAEAEEALFQAAANGHACVVRALLAGSPLERQSSWSWPWDAWAGGAVWTFAHEALLHGEVSVVECYLDLEKSIYGPRYRPLEEGLERGLEEGLEGERIQGEELVLEVGLSPALSGSQAPPPASPLSSEEEGSERVWGESEMLEGESVIVILNDIQQTISHAIRQPAAERAAAPPPGCLQAPALGASPDLRAARQQDRIKLDLEPEFLLDPSQSPRGGESPCVEERAGSSLPVSPHRQWPTWRGRVASLERLAVECGHYDILRILQRRRVPVVSHGAPVGRAVPDYAPLLGHAPR